MEQPGLSELVESRHIPSKRDIDTDAQIAEAVQAEAWGHHACGTCKIGHENDDAAVLDSNFKVRGLEGLRVVATPRDDLAP